MDFRDQTIIITGASSGIGRELAFALSRRGARVGLVARRAELLAETAEAVRSAGGTAAWAAADAGDRDALHAAVRAIEAELGPANGAIANAGVSRRVRLDPFNVADQEMVMRTNYLGAMYTFEAVLPGLLERRRGLLVSVSSLAGFRGLPGQGAYCASKAALSAYTDALRVQLRGTGVRAVTVCPGFVRTPLIAGHPKRLPLLISAERAAERIARALERGRGAVHFPLGTRALVWASRLLPEWALARALRGSF